LKRIRKEGNYWLTKKCQAKKDITKEEKKEITVTMRNVFDNFELFHLSFTAIFIVMMM
jgi:hypothetical protein